jgi:TRAP-type C4-dicarboxylate transport system substrate-binding protein
LHVREEAESKDAIRSEGGEIVAITQEEREAFVSAVTPIYGEARRQYGRDLLALVNL